MLTNGVSGVAVVLRVGLLCRLRDSREAEEEEDQQEVTLSSLMDGLREQGRWHWPYNNLIHLLTLFTI